MRHFKRILLGLILLLVAAATLVFVLENRQVATLVLFGWTTPQLPMAVFVSAALLLGLLVSPLLGMMFYGRLRMQLASRQRQLVECQKELARLTKQPAAE
ncbi:lipopolysaccharide assembly protein LapA domain-containing protein [Azotobacter chroococcum]|uniref:lipopolysaccharide assembly protein LapA domain-containing protein n=1 Tax=Azotobacter chroococcum TaxID=353 RepID=UPI0010AE5635|nr:lipopolysaccharide assembly protein LapA domain-containing protein [Azotobacter chroococcum]TKD44144.1 LapA family protein [Azotobacter chroococcum]